jgi:hypothetical protein
MYSTYAIFQSMTEDVRHILEIFQNAPQSVKDGFKVGGWDFDTQTTLIIDSTTSRNQLSMAFLIAIEIILIIIAIFVIILQKDYGERDK